jgi:hypothetical protein
VGAIKTGPASSRVEGNAVVNVSIDGVVPVARPDEFLIEVINRSGGLVPHVCYHPQLSPVQTCDTCLVEANGRLVRACATRPFSFFGLLRRLGNKDTLRGLAAAIDFLQAFGRHLHSSEERIPKT